MDRHRFEPRRGRPSIKLSREPVCPRKAIFGEIIGGAAQDNQRRLLPPRQRLCLRRIARKGTDRIGHRLPVAMVRRRDERSEEHTSELQSLMRISFAVLCLNKNTNALRLPAMSVHTQKYKPTHR